MRALLSRDEVQARLQRIFPRDAFDPVHSNPLAASALAAMLYVDAVVPDTGTLPDDAVWARPSMCLWMSDDAYAFDDEERRRVWLVAALRSRKRVEEVQAEWGIPNASAWYADNSRETLRDETFPAWLEHGAMRDRPGLATTSSYPRWALSEAFADLFDPALDGDALDAAIEAWRGTHMSPGDRFRSPRFAIVSEQGTRSRSGSRMGRLARSNPEAPRSSCAVCFRNGLRRVLLIPSS